MRSPKFIGAAFAAAMLIPAVAFAQSAQTNQPAQPAAPPAAAKSSDAMKSDATAKTGAEKKQRHASNVTHHKKTTKSNGAATDGASAMKNGSKTDSPTKQ